VKYSLRNLSRFPSIAVLISYLERESVLNDCLVQKGKYKKNERMRTEGEMRAGGNDRVRGGNQEKTKKGIYRYDEQKERKKLVVQRSEESPSQLRNRILQKKKQIKNKNNNNKQKNERTKAHTLKQSTNQSTRFNPDDHRQSFTQSFTSVIGTTTTEPDKRRGTGTGMDFILRSGWEGEQAGVTGAVSVLSVEELPRRG
jgi:hypothetical protein